MKQTDCDTCPSLSRRESEIAAKDTEIASLRTRLDAAIDREGKLLLRIAEKDKDLALVQDGHRRSFERYDSTTKELTAIHAAHRAAVVRWSYAEALNRTLQSELRLSRSGYESLHSQLDTAATDRARLRLELADAIQKHDDYKKKVLEAGYSDQSAEIRRLKSRVNDLVCILDQIRSQTSHAPRETP